MKLVGLVEPNLFTCFWVCHNARTYLSKFQAAVRFPLIINRSFLAKLFHDFFVCGLESVLPRETIPMTIMQVANIFNALTGERLYDFGRQASQNGPAVGNRCFTPLPRRNNAAKDQPVRIAIRVR